MIAICAKCKLQSNNICLRVFKKKLAYECMLKNKLGFSQKRKRKTDSLRHKI